WGIDVGIDQKLGQRGVFGINFFNREIKDKIERVNTGGTVDIDGDTYKLFTYRNLGDARAYGIEVDVSTPLDMVGLPDTSIFANYTWLQTELTDPVTGKKRGFNEQPDYIYNIGLLQNLPSWNSTVGVTYQKRGMSKQFEFDEIEKLTYQGNL